MISIMKRLLSQDQDYFNKLEGEKRFRENKIIFLDFLTIDIYLTYNM